MSDSKFMQEFMQMLILIEESTGGSCSDQMKKFLWRKLGPMGRDTVIVGLEKILMNYDPLGNKFPPIGEFTKAIQGTKQDALDTFSIDAEKAADKVMWAVGRYGRSKSIKFEDPFVTSSIRSIGVGSYL